MRNINKIIPIVAVAFVTLLLIFDIKSDCANIRSFNIERGKVLYQKFQKIKSEYKKLIEEKKKISEKYKEEFKRVGAEEEFNKVDKNLKTLIEKINKYADYLKNPDKFKDKYCGSFCVKDSDTCNYKYELLLKRAKEDLERADNYLTEMEKILFNFKISVEKRDLLMDIITTLLKDIQQKSQIMERTIVEYIRKYPFNKDEIAKRGKFYLEKIQKEKELIEKALRENNFYKLVKYCKLWEFKRELELKCLEKNIQKFVENKKGDKTTDCETLKIDLIKACSSKINTIYNEFKKTFEELDKDFFVILLDKKAEYVAVFSVYSWDDNRDYPTEHAKIYKVKIPESLFRDLENFVKSYGYENWVCRYRYGGYLECRISNPYLREIVQYIVQNNPFYYDNTFEIYIEDLYKAFYHKYAFKGNLYKDSPQVKWVEVDEETYRLFNEKNKIVMVKPKGYFGDQMIIKPNKIYSSLVGNQHYGYYDNQGIWHWLPMYLFLMNYLDRYYYGQPRNIPSEYKDEVLRDYYSRKKILREYAKKHGLCKNGECDKGRASGTGSYRGGLRGLGSRYRGRGYGGLGK